MRTAAEDVELGGQQVKKGDWLMINYVAANHDPAQFPDARRFDAARSPNRHLAFGAGAHQCLGLHLARLEMKILFEAILDRVAAVEPAGEAKRASSTFVGGLKTLPLKVTPA
ncbi:Cytochrome P450 [Porphyrobacter sp. LM 6]|nr:Cytochrome P450 [Porphyrobacter sp. LM 6]